MGQIKVDKYDSKTGKGTLSYYARQYGTTVNDLAKLNKITDINAITEGQNLMVPDNSLRQSTNQYRNETNTNMSTFNQKYANGTGSLGVGRPTDGSLTVTGTKQNADGTWTNTLSDGSTSVVNEKMNADGTATATEVGTGTGKGSTVVDPFAGLSDEEANLKSTALKTINEIKSNYNNIQKFADQTHIDLINATTKLYEARIAKMEDSNKRLLATKGTANIRQGRSRYASDIATGILTDEEMDGQGRISELEGAMLTAIAEANQAKADGDMTRFNAAFDRVDKVNKELTEQIQTNYKNAIDYDKSLREREKADRDAVKADFELKAKRAETSAPALAESMMKLTSDEERAQFLEEYSKQSGIDLDILMGEVSTATKDAKYKDLQFRNIENQIANRNSSNALAWSRENRLRATEEEDKNSDVTNNILGGLTKFNEVEDPKLLEETKSQLSEYGLFSSTPPQWFIDEYETQAVSDGDTSASPQEIQSQWEQYRRDRGII